MSAQDVPEAKAKVPLLPRLIPAVGWLRSYKPATLPKDLIGAVIVWALVVPESVAYAQIVGVPPQYAFPAAVVGLIVYALLGTSRHLILGATSAVAVMTASALSAAGVTGDAILAGTAIITISAGLILVIAGVCKLGFISRFLPEPALTGFLFGASLIIVIRQVPKLFGIDGGDGGFFPRLWTVISNLGDTSWPTLAIGVASIVAMLVMEKFIPRLPAGIIVLLAMIAASTIFGWGSNGIDVVGEIPTGLVGFKIPDTSGLDMGALIAGGAGVALIIYAESVSVAKKLASGTERIDSNQELIATGTANLAAGFFQGFAVSGSTSRSAAATEGGSKTPLTSMAAAVLIALTALFLMPVFTNLPEAVLGAVVIVAVRSFMSFKPLKTYWKVDRGSFAVCLAALVGVLAFDLLPGLIIAVVLSLILFIAMASSKAVSRMGLDAASGRYLSAPAHPGVVQPGHGIAVIRPDAGLFYGNAEAICDEIVAEAEHEKLRVVVVNLELTRALSFQVCDALDDLSRRLTARNIELYLCHVHAEEAARLRASGTLADVGEDHMLSSVEAAVALAQAKIGR